MKKYFFILFCIALCWNSIILAQNDSQKVQDSEGNEILPEQIGKIMIESYYDESFAQTLPKSTLILFEEKFDSLISTFKSHSLLNPPKGFDVKFIKRIQK